MNQPRYPGRQLTLGDRTFIVPALTLGAIEQLQETFEGFERLTMREQLRTAIDIALRALRRNYPDLTRDELVELVDMRSCYELFDAVMVVSGLVREGELGKALAAASGGTGSPSTPTSAPVSAGPSSTAASA